VEPSRHNGLAQLHERYYPELVRLAFALTGDWSLAEELGQEAFVRAHAWHVIFWRGLAWALTGVAPSGVGTVVGIDPAANRVVVHGAPFRSAPMAIAAGPDGLWVVFANPDHTGLELVHLVLASGPN